MHFTVFISVLNIGDRAYADFSNNRLEILA